MHIEETPKRQQPHSSSQQATPCCSRRGAPMGHKTRPEETGKRQKGHLERAPSPRGVAAVSWGYIQSRAQVYVHPRCLFA